MMIEMRKFKSVDREGVIALWSSVFPDAAPQNQPELMLEKKLEVDDLIFVAVDDRKVVGACMAGYDGHRGWLYSLAVRPDIRRQGIGRLLVEKCIHELNRMGCVKVNLQIRENNLEVKGFYESLGFNVEERLSMGKLLKN